MNLEKLHSIVETLNVAGIKNAVIEKRDDDSVYVCGADDEGEEPSIVIVSETDKDVVKHTMAINRLSILLSRLNLFDLSKSKVEEVADTFTKRIVVKESRRKVSYTFADPKQVMVPSLNIEDGIVTSVTLDKAYVQDLIKAQTAMSPTKKDDMSTPMMLTLKGINNEVVLELFDQTSDTFSDVVGNNTNGEWSYDWRADSIMRLLRHSIKTDDEVELGIGKFGILYIEVNKLIFMVMPQVAD